MHLLRHQQVRLRGVTYYDLIDSRQEYYLKEIVLRLAVTANAVSCSMSAVVILIIMACGVAIKSLAVLRACICAALTKWGSCFGRHEP